MDWSKVKEEPADATTNTLAALAHDYVAVMKKFEETSKRCVFKIGDLCARIPNDWRCGIISCPYCAPVFLLYFEEIKQND
jgi:hypothetical protein